MITEEIICAKFLEMLDSTPYTKIKASDLAKTAGISRSSFYFYFDSISAVLRHLEDEFVAGLPDDEAVIRSYIAHEHHGKSLAQSTTLAAEYWGKNLDVFRILSGPNGDPSFQQRLHVRTCRILDKFFGASVPNIRKQLLAEAMSAAQWAMYRWWANHPKEVTIEELAKHVAELFNGWHLSA